jgi:hypothetical protein
MVLTQALIFVMDGHEVLQIPEFVTIFSVSIIQKRSKQTKKIHQEL